MISTMFKPQAGSPSTELSADITDSDTDIPVIDVSVLPEGPNIVTLSANDQFESVIYQSKDEANNKLVEVTRGIEGIAQGWASGTEVARNFTARDLETIQLLLTELYYDSTFTNDKTTAIKNLTTSGTAVNEYEVFTFTDSMQLNHNFGDGNEVTEININGEVVISESEYSVTNDYITISTSPLFTYKTNNSTNTFNLNLVYNDGFTESKVAITITETPVETDEGQILSETTLA